MLIALNPDQTTIIVLAAILAIVVLAVLAPASLGVLLKAVESLVAMIRNSKTDDTHKP